MGAAKKLLEQKVLRNLVPLNALSAVHLEEISKKAVIEEVRSGRYVFKKGDRDYQSVYLIEGTLEFIEKGREVMGTLDAGSEAARHPLAHKQPRQLSARATGTVTVARIDSSLLDVLLTWDESSGYDVVEIDAEKQVLQQGDVGDVERDPRVDRAGVAGDRAQQEIGGITVDVVSDAVGSAGPSRGIEALLGPARAEPGIG